MTNASVTVNNTATIILAANPNRRGWTVVNNHATVDFYLGFTSSIAVGSSASNNGGMLVKAAGANKISSADFFDKSQDCYKGDIYAICGSASLAGVGEC